MSDSPLIVPKGTRVYSTAPGWPNDGRLSQRQLKVWRYRRVVDRFVWAGSGGYWRWVEQNDSALGHNADTDDPQSRLSAG